MKILFSTLHFFMVAVLRRLVCCDLLAQLLVCRQCLPKSKYVLSFINAKECFMTSEILPKMQT